MKKQKFKNLSLNKQQISTLRGGTSGPVTGTGQCNYTDTCPTIFDNTCYATCRCESEARTCYSEAASVCGGCPTMDPGGCEITIVTTKPSFSRKG